MGIRVSCPNGHVLNVKSHLAGKKGRCPTCDAIFEVPNSAAEEELDPDSPRTAFDQIDIEQLTRESREAPRKPAGEPRPRPTESRAPAPGEESISIALADAPSKVSRPENGPPAEITSDPSAVWYVRRVSGEQYGPAQGMMFWQWVQEGRVPEDSHVWKQGWPEWKSAREWLARKEPAAQRAPQQSLPPSRASTSPDLSPVTASAASRPTVASLSAAKGPQAFPAAASPVTAAATRSVRRRKGNDVTAMVIIVLLLAFLASLTGAIIVVYRSMQ